MPFRAPAHPVLPRQPVGRPPAVLDGRDFAGEVRNEIAIRVDEPKRREDLPPDALIDLDTGHEGMKDGRLLRQSRDHLPAWLVGRIGRTFRLSKCGSWNGQSRRRARAEQHEMAAVRYAWGKVAQRRNVEFASFVRQEPSPSSRAASIPLPRSRKPGNGD